MKKFAIYNCRVNYFVIHNRSCFKIFLWCVPLSVSKLIKEIVLRNINDKAIYTK